MSEGCGGKPGEPNCRNSRGTNQHSYWHRPWFDDTKYIEQGCVTGCDKCPGCSDCMIDGRAMKIIKAEKEVAEEGSMAEVEEESQEYCVAHGKVGCAKCIAAGRPMLPVEAETEASESVVEDPKSMTDFFSSVKVGTGKPKEQKFEEKIKTVAEEAINAVGDEGSDEFGKRELKQIANMRKVLPILEAEIESEEDRKKLEVFKAMLSEAEVKIANNPDAGKSLAEIEREKATAEAKFHARRRRQLVKGGFTATKLGMETDGDLDWAQRVKIDDRPAEEIKGEIKNEKEIDGIMGDMDPNDIFGKI